jgi:hypothetical protein
MPERALDGSARAKVAPRLAVMSCGCAFENKAGTSERACRLRQLQFLPQSCPIDTGMPEPRYLDQASAAGRRSMARRCLQHPDPAKARCPMEVSIDDRLRTGTTLALHSAS